jgi:hypothetical protein
MRRAGFLLVSFVLVSFLLGGFLLVGFLPGLLIFAVFMSFLQV